nr:hypothetical protein [Gemmatimonadota bacterium]
MKLFDVDWTSVLRELGRWDALTLPARDVLLHELKTHGYAPAMRFEPYLAEVVHSGIAVYEPDKQRLWLGDERRALVKVLRAMGRHQIFHVAPREVSQHLQRETLLRYMQEHFTGDEVQRIASAALRSRVYATRQTLLPFVEYPAWVGDLLAADDQQSLLDWADTHGLNSADYVSDGTVLFDLQELARTLLDHPDGLPLRELLATLDDDEIPPLASAIHTGLSSMVVFGGMRAEDLEPTIGLWPTVTRELTRSPPVPPTVVKVGETFVLALHMEDMTTLLAAIASSPVRVRANDGAVFARTRADIERRLVVPPAWVTKFLEANRVDHASSALLAYGFVAIRDVDGNPHLHATPAGMSWLTLSAHERLAALVEPMRRSKEKNPRDSYDIERTASFFPYSLPFYQAPKSLNLRADLVRAFLQARDGFIRIDAFIDYGTREDNPLLAQANAPSGKDPGLVFYSGYSDPRG